MRRVTKNILSPQEKVAKALAEATVFAGANQLGSIMFLPTQIESRVALRYIKDCYGSIIPQIVCVISPRDRQLHIYGDDPANDIVPISTPKLVFAYDAVFDKENNRVRSGKGRLFKTKSKSDQPLLEALKEVDQYFFPHVYFNSPSNGYMCTRCQPYSPRAINTRFWTSNFSKNWKNTYNADWSFGAGSTFYPATKPADYQRHQETYCPYRSKTSRSWLAAYSNYFELSEKPKGIFISSNPEIVEQANENINGIVVGFAFLRDQTYWVWLKDGQFLRLKPEQVKVY